MKEEVRVKLETLKQLAMHEITVKDIEPDTVISEFTNALIVAKIAEPIERALNDTTLEIVKRKLDETLRAISMHENMRNHAEDEKNHPALRFEIETLMGLYEVRKVCDEIITEAERTTHKPKVVSFDFENTYYCSICEEYLLQEYNFCPYCGQPVDWSKHGVDNEEVSDKNGDRA